MRVGCGVWVQMLASWFLALVHWSHGAGAGVTVALNPLFLPSAWEVSAQACGEDGGLWEPAGLLEMQPRARQEQSPRMSETKISLV